ncbi:MAG: hypothetical protein EZS28_013726 [Streblomastix strix]|uniref:Uncharacterized protein n=1 Tax=Streblomastix strix TaxID=222440 RepID=A0A5J4W8M6_9EUKA|nr:MAG: hypothetical protein EZS28_013726 [Streblomastix strix]
MYFEQLGEQDHMGCVTSSIMAIATLCLTEIHRTQATRNEDGSWQLDTAWRKSRKTITSYEYLSKEVHMITKGAGVQAKNSVKSVQKYSITKSNDQGTSQQEVDRASRHKEGAGTVAVHYDMNLIDRLRETNRL